MRWLGPAAIAIAFIVMAAWSWGAWPDVLIDYGREVYVPWRITEGAVLYRDIACFNGPLSPYVNALWMALFGDSILTLSIANLLVAAALTVLLHRLVAQISSEVVATVCGLVFVSIFAFGHLLPVGNYNYITPYSHEMTHGMLLSLLGVSLLARYAVRPRLVLMAGAGLALGLVFLTKPEFFLAAAIAMMAGLGGGAIVTRSTKGGVLRSLAVFVPCAAAPVVVAFGAMCTAMPATDALYATLGGWTAVFNRELLSLPFYRKHTGLDDVGENIWRMFDWLALYAAVFVPAIIVAFSIRGGVGLRRAVAGLLALIAFVTLMLIKVDWSQSLRPAPLLLIIAALIAVFDLLRVRNDPSRAPARLAGLMLIIFAGLLLSKMLLAVRLPGYGFALAMPLVMVLTIIFFHWLPLWVSRHKGSGLIIRAATAGVLGALVVANASRSAAFYGLKTQPIGVGADAILAVPDGRTRGVADLLAFLAQGSPAEETLLILPEGAMINFLTRRVNPTPFAGFMPPEVILFGESEMVGAIAARPPDIIAIWEKSTWEYGAASLRYYAPALFQWVHEHYETVDNVGVFSIMRLRDRRPGLSDSQQ